MPSGERAPEQGLSPRKHLVVKLRQRCWREALHFLKCRLVFKTNAFGGSLCAVGRGQKRPLSPLMIAQKIRYWEVKAF